ncbi:hypothetical protein DF3PB_4510001 [uncultured Defluviicoccus sp.]|uniref:HPt domain-containing protein n=1 Tax=metagenome TaxID=256318 RepID=A0A380TGT3_9ZZZZ|nr:hypothetical protein DF3PB_4510001 [uncultured Defluviicoccus sp.]
MGASIGLQELWNEPCENADRLQNRPEPAPRTDDRTQARDVNDRVRCAPMAKSDQVPRRTEGPRRTDGNSRPPSAVATSAGAATIGDTVPLLDSNALQTLRDLSGPGDETFFVEVIDLYLKDSVALVGAIRQAALSRDAHALMPAAHSLRSSSGNVGAASLSAVCRALECAASGNGMDDVDPLLAQLERIYPLVCRALRVECERTQP